MSILQDEKSVLKTALGASWAAGFLYGVHSHQRRALPVSAMMNSFERRLSCRRRIPATLLGKK